MPTTGSGKSPSPGPGPAEQGANVGGSGGGSKSQKSGSMKIKRSVSAGKMLTKSKSSGSLKKKGELSSSGAKTSSRDVHRSLSASEEMDLLTMRLNGMMGEGEGLDEEEDQGEEKKEASIKGLWKKAVKSMKSPGSDSKWLNRPSFKRRDSRLDSEEAELEEPKEIDPVYSLLKCAADLPKVSRANKEGQLGSQCQGAHCAGHGSSPSSQGGMSLLSAPGGVGTCVSCGPIPHSPDSTSHRLGHDFKQFYKQTSPIKRLSAAELGI